ncbi:hypothetical protein EI427_15670 [Flammeovirga pectinis]|uniref:L,D-TPase catalytic domain-containing protein n=1 Tax=Flammeovirga pectinis TaxID=2494373 RepID=A0A3Q9FN57_9BACT|nr:L,D-transpeptidase family protein [Flammeovirga pectinis]AZQ63609.1 hypothetical protein EI427_15670 [Flammeovirga pectinis]
MQTLSTICFNRFYYLVVFSLCLLTFPSFAQEESNISIKREIHSILDQIQAENSIDGISLFSDSLMPLVYETVDYKPLWTSKKNINDILVLINNAYFDGLTPSHYHLEKIQELIASDRGIYQEALLDILLTDAGVLLISHYIWGKVQPETISSTWNFDTKEFTQDRIPLIIQPIENEIIPEAFSTFIPSDELYIGLKKSLADFRKIKENGGWNKLPKMDKIEVGDENEYIPELRKRLAVTSTLFTFDTLVLKIDTTYRSQIEEIEVTNAPSVTPEVDTIRSIFPYSTTPILDSSYVKVAYLDTTSTVYDENLKKSVVKFQKMYGLETDGKVGKATLKALNTPIENRINTLRINLERSRWIFHEDTDNFIFVNIASFQLFLHKNNKWFYQTRVVVGKTFHQTPVFKSKLSYIDINPTWTVPYSIASKEMLPKLKKDAGYLAKHNMKLYDRANLEVDPQTIDWKSIKQNNFPYVIVQGSGPRNALGHVKFIFPNKYSIYLHDTPSRYLFSKNSRAFSHGCIRVYKPLELAEVLLDDPENYSLEKINEIVKEEQLKRVFVKDRPTVYLLYFTALLGPSESIHFYDDIYSRDQRVLKALNKSLY